MFHPCSFASNVLLITHPLTYKKPVSIFSHLFIFPLIITRNMTTVTDNDNGKGNLVSRILHFSSFRRKKRSRSPAEIENGAPSIGAKKQEKFVVVIGGGRMKLYRMDAEGMKEPEEAKDGVKKDEEGRMMKEEEEEGRMMKEKEEEEEGRMKKEEEESAEETDVEDNIENQKMEEEERIKEERMVGDGRMMRAGNEQEERMMKDEDEEKGKMMKEEEEEEEERRMMKDEEEEKAEESDVEDNIEERKLEEELVEMKEEGQHAGRVQGKHPRATNHFTRYPVEDKGKGQFGGKMAEVEVRQEQQEEEEEMSKSRMEQYERLLEEANEKIHQLAMEDEDKQKQIEQLHDKLEQALDAATETLNAHNQQNGADQNGAGNEEVQKLRMEVAKLEQKLKDATQEKDYYKKHFKGENGENGTHNGRGPLNDDFGRELMMANKRKYHLESRIKQLEMELRETQQRAIHLGESVKNAEKLLWLEKERSATLEREREQLWGEMAELRNNGEALKRELEQLRGEGAPASIAFGDNRQQQEQDASRIRDEYEQRVAELRDMSDKMDWRLGEVTQQYHDTKWRLGEVEATLAHRDWELDQAKNRIKQLEASVAATPAATQNEDMERMKEELARRADEKSKLEWRLGEMSQWWNDAKWRVGELEAETAHRSQMLDQAHHRIGELERRLENNLHYEDVKRDKEMLEGRAIELEKTFNDAKWRIGELEAELTRARARGGNSEEVQELREQKSKLEWRLGEMTQWWNDAKWRIGELESALRHKETELQSLKQNWEGGQHNSRSAAMDRLASLAQDGTFLIRKQPSADRHKWNLLTWDNDALKGENVQLKRCWFETEASSSDNNQPVFLIGSFTNWECALRCDPVPERPSRRGTWLDLPPGRHEFRFIRDGQWHTEPGYGECWNEHGTRNNWMDVE